MDELQRLVDEAAIVQLTYQYSRGIDLLDRALYKSCFTDPVEIDFESWDGTQGPMPADGWVDYVWDLVVGLDATQHIMTNHNIDFDDDDHATCIAYLHAQHYIAGAPVETFTAGGFYTNSVVRTDGGWRIGRCKLTLTWRTGDVGILELGKKRPPRSS